MKKLFILFAIAMLGMIATAQDVTRLIGSGGTLPANDYLPYFPCSAADTISTYRDSLAIEFMVNKPQELYVSAITKVIDVSTGGKVAVSLQTKKFGAHAWTTLQTITYYGGGTDSTLNFGQDTAKLKGNYYRALYKFVAGKTRVSTNGWSLKY